MARLSVGQAAPLFTASTVDGGSFSLSSMQGKRILLAFHRYASCPICNFSLKQFAARYQDLQDKGITYVPIFHSSIEKLKEYYPEPPPYQIISDPAFKLYRLYGLEPSLMGFLHPKALRDGLRALQSWASGFKPGFSPDGELLTVPADFLIDAQGSIERLHYGVSAGDSWTVDQVLAFA